MLRGCTAALTDEAADAVTDEAGDNGDGNADDEAVDDAAVDDDEGTADPVAPAVASSRNRSTACRPLGAIAEM